MNDATLYHPRPERWPQFSLRGLLLTLTILSVWLGVKVQHTTAQKRVVAAIRSDFGHSIYDYQWPTETSTVDLQATSPVPQWLIDLLGVDFFHDVVYVVLDSPSVTDATLERLDAFAQLKFVFIANSRVTNGGLKHLRALRKLRRLSIQDKDIDDAGVAELASLTGLQ